MSAIQNYAIQSVISREMEDRGGLIDSTKKSKQEIFNSLWIKTNSWLLNNIKHYITNIFNTEK